MAHFRELICNIVLSRKVENGLLSGTVILTCPQIKVIQLALVEIVGSAACSWKSDRTLICPNFIPKGTEFSGRENFYYSRHILCGGDIPHKHRGAETFHFSCGWPSRLPTSWEGEFGTVSFKGKVIIYESQDIHVHLQNLTVGFYRDLTLEQHLLHESRVDIHRTFQLAMTRLGSVDISVWVPISGIAAGQSLPVLCTVTNTSKLHFGGLIVVLTRIEICKSSRPYVSVKKTRHDVCRVARMVNIHSGSYHYYCMLEVDPATPPTNQFYKCGTCQIIYELWVSVQGSFSKYAGLGYPDTETPGVPIVIGTEPLRFYNDRGITSDVLEKLFTTHGPVFMDMLPPDEEVEELLHNADEELDEATIKNLNRQVLEDNAMLTKRMEHSSASELPDMDEP